MMITLSFSFFDFTSSFFFLCSPLLLLLLLLLSSPFPPLHYSVELLYRRPLFAGNDNEEQITLMCELIGKPKQKTIDKCSRKGVREILNNCKADSKPNFGSKGFRKISDDALDILSKMLTFDPDDRYTGK
jgi:serine/threonine protein kinase